MIKGRHILTRTIRKGSNLILGLGRGSLGKGTKIIEGKLSLKPGNTLSKK